MGTINRIQEQMKQKKFKEYMRVKKANEEAYSRKKGLEVE